jgi:DNA polymerase III subunit alpha
VLAAGASAQKDKASGQFSLFGDALDEVAAPAPSTSGGMIEPWTKEQMLADEKELLGFYISGHPLDPWRSIMENGTYRKIGGLEELSERERKKSKFAVFVADITVKYTKSGKQFAIMRVEDFTGSKEMMVWGEEYEKFGRTMTKGSVVEVTAKVEQDSRNDTLQLVAQSIKPLEAPAAATLGAAAAATVNNGNGIAAAQTLRPLVLQLDTARDSIADLRTIHAILTAHPGKVPVHLSVRANGRRVHLVAAAGIAAEEAVMEELRAWV